MVKLSMRDIQKLLSLKEKDSVKINAKVYTIKKRFFHKADLKDYYEQDTTRYELSNNYVLEFHGETPNLFQLIHKKYIFGFTGTSSKNETIKTIELA
ncbi:hypothetical protein HYU21_01930 [Candidatus Woesearchaeota archaeon]|nr:hypothetical protein [Candidatus Woesearchaeota archaeon]